MQSALANVEGVEEVSVDFKTKTAHVKSNGKVKAEALAEALENAGFGTSCCAEQ